MTKFAHLADCHIGAWRDPKMRMLGDEAFRKAVDSIVEEEVDFVVIAGDLFNTALPGIDHIKFVVKQLRRLKQIDIPAYYIAGSHDYSPTGKTMLDVLEEAGLCVNVFKGAVRNETLYLDFTEDKKTGVKLTGILGKAGQLDTELYEQMSREHLEKEEGKKVFLFHTTLTELKPKDMDKVESQSVSFLPKGFDYYAGGHVHIVESIDLPGYVNVVYPGPLFPASFSEVEKLKNGGLYIVDLENDTKKRIEIVTKEVISRELNCDGKTPDEVNEYLAELENVKDKIVLIRLIGTLKSGKATDVNFKGLFEKWEKEGAYFCMKNTTALKTKDMVLVKTEATTAEEAENTVIEVQEDKKLIKELLIVLSRPQAEGEKKKEYEERILNEAMELI